MEELIESVKTLVIGAVVAMAHLTHGSDVNHMRLWDATAYWPSYADGTLDKLMHQPEHVWLDITQVS
jgi:hypothetical protein